MSSGKKLFKGLKCLCWVNKGYKVILEYTVQDWDDLRLLSYFEGPVQMYATLKFYGVKVIELEGARILKKYACTE